MARSNVCTSESYIIAGAYFQSAQRGMVHDVAFEATVSSQHKASSWPGNSYSAALECHVAASSLAASAGAFPAPSQRYNKYCHFCQHVKNKSADSMFTCQTCPRRFCGDCLKVHLVPKVAEDHGMLPPSDKNWSCSVCSKSCCCSLVWCTHEHRHCKAYRYRRRRADKARSESSASGSTAGKRAVMEGAEGDVSQSALPTLAAVGVTHSPDSEALPVPLSAKVQRVEQADDVKGEGRKASIESLLDGDPRSQAWRMP